MQLEFPFPLVIVAGHWCINPDGSLRNWHHSRDDTTQAQAMRGAWYSLWLLDEHVGRRDLLGGLLVSINIHHEEEAFWPAIRVALEEYPSIAPALRRMNALFLFHLSVSGAYPKAPFIKQHSQKEYLEVAVSETCVRTVH